MGILGLGNIGIPVAQIAHGFGMEVIAWSPNLTAQRSAAHGVECVSRAELFARADVVSIHMPLSTATEGLVGKKEIGQMKPDAYLINTSRPQIVEEAALIDALSQGRLAGAGLDVFEREPLPVDHPFRLLPNVVATPHIGFATEENYNKFFGESLENLAAFLAGKPIRTICAGQPFLPDSQVARGMRGRADEGSPPG
jgi:phosphoglycerate dehydrogenase-like enzyme